MKVLCVAVIGSGISGLSAAWLLSRRHRVTLYECADRAGGHSHTVEAEVPEGACPVDTGFIVYNEATYPNLVRLFETLGVATAPASMGFAVSMANGRYEYSGNDSLGLIGGMSNLADPGHWRMTRDIFRFFRSAERMIGTAGEDVTLGEFLERERYSTAFIERHILPMGAAIWSCPAAAMLGFPAASYVRFFANHGLLKVTGRPVWRTVVGGSRVYVGKMLDGIRRSPLGSQLRLGEGVKRVRRDGGAVVIEDRAGGVHTHDQVVIATPANQALALLGDPDPAERALLGAFGYSRNDTFLHTDRALMPSRRRLWSSWNYIGSGLGENDSMTATYWMNRLQPLDTRTDLFVTLNPVRPIADHHVQARLVYEHPVFDRAAMAAQRGLWSLQGRRRTWFAGSYFGYGFHEDGLQSGLAVAEQLGGVRRPWQVDDESGRIHVTAPARRTLPEAA